MPEDPHGAAVDLIRRCYSSWMDLPSGRVRVRWYRVPDGTPWLNDPAPWYASSDWDEGNLFWRGQGEDYVNRSPFTDWRDCGPPSAWPPADCPDCPGIPPQALKLVFPGPLVRNGLRIPSPNEAILLYRGGCTWESDPADAAWYPAVWRLTQVAGRPVASLSLDGHFSAGSVPFAVVLPWDCLQPLTLHAIGGGSPNWAGTGDVSFKAYLGKVDMPLIGQVITDAGTDAVPTRYLECDGRAVSRSTYATLFARVGTAFGAGDGLTTFNIPDFRGRVGLGRDGATYNTGGAGGEATHLLTVAELPAHSHPLTDPGHRHTANAGADFITTGGATIRRLTTGGTLDLFNVNGSDSATTGITEGNTGGNTPHNNLPPYRVVRYLIYAGV